MFPIYLMIICMSLPIIFFSGLMTWGFHSHFIIIRYMTRGPLGGALFALVHFYAFCLTTLAHPTCVYPSLVDDTRIVGPTLNMVHVFLWLYYELSALRLLMQLTKCVT